MLVARQDIPTLGRVLGSNKPSIEINLVHSLDKEIRDGIDEQHDSIGSTHGNVTDENLADSGNRLRILVLKIPGAIKQLFVLRRHLKNRFQTAFAPFEYVSSV